MHMHRMGLWLGAALIAAPLAAQDEPQDGAAREQAQPPAIPDLSSEERDLGDERKYIYFHKAGVSYEEALADVQECAAHATHLQQRTGKSFVPWGRNDAGLNVTYDGGQYGLVGAVIGAIIAGPLERSIRQSIMIRCLDPRGYTRYRANKDQWQQLIEDGENPNEMLAAIASGPVPPTPKANP